MRKMRDRCMNEDEDPIEDEEENYGVDELENE